MIIDCFCGGGGASVGIEMALGRSPDIAINHDPWALKMHTVNHPNTIHLEEDIFEVDLKKHVKGKHVSLMWASPTCTHFSRAKGGKPLDNQMRILPWSVRNHARDIEPDVIVMENVKEILGWGPLKNGRPVDKKKGKHYRRFISAMYKIGYTKIEWKILCAADYGAPTIRERWFCILRRDGIDIKWPEPTHNKNGTDGKKKWVGCGDYIDWSDLGTSIFDRKKPLADATQKRIANGIKKYIIDNPHPYIVKDKRAISFVIQYHGETRKGDSRGQLLTEPLKTIDTSNRYGIVTAFISQFNKSSVGFGCDEPLRTLTTSPGHFGLVCAFMIKYYGTGDNVTGLDEPIGTITTKDRFGLVSVVLDGQKYIITDIFLRMLKPEESKMCQGFPKDYVINRDIQWNKYPVSQQTKFIGNSVCPMLAAAIIKKAVPYLIGKYGRAAMLNCIQENTGQLKFV